MYDTQRQYIEARLKDNWTYTDIAFDNIKYKPIEGTYYIRLTILDGGSEQISLGSGVQKHRNDGVISIEIFAPDGDGTKQAREYADTLAALFTAKQFNGINTRSSKIYRQGQEGAWYKLSVMTPFWVDELR